MRPRSNIDFITGLDVRNSSVQTDYSKSSNCITPPPTRLFEGTNRDPAVFFRTFFPSIFSSEEEDRAYVAAGRRGGPFLGLEDGRASCDGKEEEGLQRPSGGGEHRALRDIGFFGQLLYRPTRSVKVVAGWRMDNGRVDLNRGYGTVTTPRLAFVYSPGPFVAKVTYAEAFKEPANLERFSTIPPIRNVAGTDLQPERVRNLDIAVGRQTATYGIDLAAYRARYTNVIGVTESSAYKHLNTAEFHNFADRLAEEWYFTLCSYYDCLATALLAIPELEVRQRVRRIPPEQRCPQSVVRQPRGPRRGRGPDQRHVEMEERRRVRQLQLHRSTTEDRGGTGAARERHCAASRQRRYNGWQ